jgi:hypothetical protein
LFVTDHIVMPVSSAKSVYPYTTSGQFPGGLAQDYLEPLAMLEPPRARDQARSELGISVLVIPIAIRSSPRKMLATIDVPLEGRVILGRGRGLAARGVRGARRAAVRGARAR